MLTMIREVIDRFDIDGVSLCFVRGPMSVGYEDIVIDDFRKKHGIDLRSIDENDIRAQRHRAGYLTEFVRSVRGMVDEAEKKKGKELELTAMLYPGTWKKGFASNLFFGFDLEIWLDERFLDGVFMFVGVA